MAKSTRGKYYESEASIGSISWLIKIYSFFLTLAWFQVVRGRTPWGGGVSWDVTGE